MMQAALATELASRGTSANLIDAILDSGYLLRNWVDPSSGRTWTSVSDMMYGNKQFSSSFQIDDFLNYAQGGYAFPKLPGLRYYEVRNEQELKELLSEPLRSHYIQEGSLTFRGQPSEHRLVRRIPNPVRSDGDGSELSIMPGAYRQSGGRYSFSVPANEVRSIEPWIRSLEPQDRSHFSASAYDVMRTEQHYANQTRGLDLGFAVETAIFFATHSFRRRESGLAYFETVPPGENRGVIYCFRFRDPPVKETQYLIKEFDIFRTHPPVRVLRQHCGLPLFMDEERNIAVTDLDCAIRLHPDFTSAGQRSPEYMFPNSLEDSFYGKLLALKDRHPGAMSSVVEYEWARNHREVP